MLAELLEEMRSEGGYFPSEVWLQIHKTFALPYVELVIPRKSCGQWEVFFVRRPATDPHWPSMWHLPGGVWRTQETEIQACNSVAQRELGIGITDIKEVMTYKWTTHPYGNPISHVCLCRPRPRPTRARDSGYFRRLPKPFISEQVGMVKESLRYLEERVRK